MCVEKSSKWPKLAGVKNMSKIEYFRQLVFHRSWGEIAERSLDLMFGYLLYAVSFLIPRKGNRWVFGTNVGFVDNAKYLFLAAAVRPRLDVCWISATRAEVADLRSRGLNAAYKYSAQGLKYCLTAKYYVFTYHSRDINFFTSGGATKINLWHGVGIKKGSKFVTKSMPEWLAHILLPHLYEKFDLFLSTSPLMNEHFRNMFDLPDNVIFEGMYPRCAFLMQPQQAIAQQILLIENDVTKELIQRLMTYDNVYIYMPTWRISLKDSFLTAAGIDFDRIEALMEQQNGMFLVKLHPAVKQENKHAAYKRVLFLDKAQDVYPVLPFTHTLITDYSSIYYDYILMPDKQVILYPFDIEDYRAHADELAFDFETYTPGKRVYSFTELCDELAAKGKNSEVQQRAWVLEQFWGDYAAKADVQQLINKIASL